MFEPINEDQAQMQIVAYLRSLGYIVFSVPNETAGKIRGGGGLARMAHLKAIATKPTDWSPGGLIWSMATTLRDRSTARATMRAAPSSNQFVFFFIYFSF